MRVTILGCGTSGGVPRIGDDWGECDPGNPRNRRLRASILVEEGASRVLVDTSPDLRAQCLAAGISRLDAVLYTHEHADHTHGIDELRVLAQAARAPVDVHADRDTLEILRTRFDYAFGRGENEGYPPIVLGHEIAGPFSVRDLAITPFPQDHGGRPSLGFRFGALSYSTDVVELPPAAFEALAGTEVWIVDALRREPHPTHANVAKALEWIERVKPARAILTHLNSQLDYATLAAELPPGVEPAYDGMIVEVPG